MKLEYIEPFIGATKETFSKLVNVDLLPGNPHVFKGKEDFLDNSAIIGLAGEAKGTVILSFSDDSSIKFAAAFTGIDIKKFDDNVKDALGELVNVVAGNAKEGLLKFKIYISLPNIIKGEVQMALMKDTPVITVPFECPMGSMNLIVALSEGAK